MRRHLDPHPQPVAARSLHEPAAFRPGGHDLRRPGWSGRDDFRRLPWRESRTRAVGVRVGFDRAPPREVDLVIAARMDCIRVFAGLRSDLTQGSKCRSVITPPHSKSRAIARATSSSTSASELRGDEFSSILDAQRQDRFSLRVSRRVLDDHASLSSDQERKAALAHVFCRRRLGMSGDSRGPGERPRHLLRPSQPNPHGPMDEGAHGAGRRCRGLRLPPCRRRRGTGHGRGLRPCGRAVCNCRRRSRRGLRRAIRSA